MGRWLADLANVCRMTGWPVVEVDGWADRARGGTGGYDTDGYQSGKPDHLMCHHTASPPSADGWPDVTYCTFDDESAPLCNLYLSRDGTIYVCAAGATNTNGSGSDPCGHIDDDTMNSSAIGIEAGNDGTGETWPARQLDAYRDLCVALGEVYGIPVGRFHGHAEWTSRKVDPAGPNRYASGAQTWDMDDFRADCATPSPEPAPRIEDVMPLLYPNDDGSFYVVAADLATRFPVSRVQADALRATGQYHDVGAGAIPIDKIEDARTAGGEEIT